MRYRYVSHAYKRVTQKDFNFCSFRNVRCFDKFAFSPFPLAGKVRADFRRKREKKKLEEIITFCKPTQALYGVIIFRYIRAHLYKFNLKSCTRDHDVVGVKILLFFWSHTLNLKKNRRSSC